MKTVFRKLIAALLVLAIVLSMLPAVFAVVGTLKPNSGVRDQVCTELSAKAKSYYTGSYSYEKLAALGGASNTSTSYNAMQNNPLYTALNSLMTVTHTNQNVRYDGYSSNSLATYWEMTDAENSSSTYLYFYTDILKSDPSVSGMTMNREHVWPKSRASYYQKGGGSDLHHLRPSIQGVNASKSNNAFANLNGAGSAYSVNGTPVIWTGSKDGVGGVLEVRNNVKGDVARILLYVYVRWQQPNLYSDVAADLLPAMDDDDSQNTGGRAIESLSTLLQWMQVDPVDDWEMSRNDQTENVQGNRNVFIDYPELAFLMFNQPIPKMQTPSGIAMSTDPTSATDPTTSSDPTAPTEPTASPTAPTTAPTEPTEATEPKGDEYALTTTLKDGDEVVIFNPGAGMAMSEDAVSTNYRAGVAATVLNNCIYTDNSKIVWTVTKTDDGYTFANDAGDTLSATKGLSFAATDNVWTLEPASTANSVYLVSTTAAGSSGDPRAVEWYGKYSEFSTYFYTASLESDFAMQLFVKTGNVAPTEPTEAPTEPTEAPTEPTTAPTEPTTAPTEPTTAPTEPTTAPTGNEYVLATSLKDGDEVVIYNAGAGKAMSEDAVSTSYRAGVDVTVTDKKIVTDDSKLVWKVTKTGDGYLFANDAGETLSATKGLSFAATDNVWSITAAKTADSVYIVSTTATGSSGDPKYVEWYDKYTEFSTYYYSEASEAIFAMQLFVKTDSTEPTEPTTAPTEPTTAPTEPTTAPTEPTTAPTEPTTAPTEPTTAPTEPTTAPTEPTTAPTSNEYVLTTSLKDGDEVIIYNAGAGKAMSEDAVSTNYRAGVDVTVSGNKIVTSDSKIVWKVTKTADGYIFTNDAGETLSATKGLSFAATDNVWAITAAKTANSVYLSSTTATGSSGDAKMIEWYDKYSEFSTYYYSEASEAIFAMQLFVKTDSTTPTEPTTAPTEPTTAPTEPTTAPTEPTTAPTEPTTAPTEPTTAPTEPTTAPTEPTTAPTEPTTAPTEPTTPVTYYTITWYVNGQAYREQCAKGEIPVFSGSTDRPDDEEYTYTFAGWQPHPVPATCDATYVATYTKEPIHSANTYVITWVVGDKTYTEKYAKGAMPVFTGSTDRPDDENYVYCFASWSPAVEKVTKNATYTALYNRIPLRQVSDFVDVPKDMWCYEEVHRSAQLGLFNGMSYLHFEPNGEVSRAMVVTVLYRMEGEPEVKVGRSFLDVPEDSWYSDAVLWASNAGIAKGTSDTTFAPNDPVTREQLAAFLYRYAAWKGYDVSGRGKLSVFTDHGDVSDYAEIPVAWAVDSDMLRGMTENGRLCLKPQGTATRAQAASIMVRFFNAFIK